MRSSCMTMVMMIGKSSSVRSPILDLTSCSADQDSTQTPGFVIQSLLKSIGMQIRHLKLLSTSLQEATPDVGDEMVNVARLVKEAGKYFGSEVALKRYSIDPKFAGQKAFSEARFAADAL